MARFTLPRDLYHGKGALEALKTFKGERAMVCVGGGSMKRDDMALGAIEALKAEGYNSGDASKYIPVVGVDATAPALEAMKEGSLLGTVLNDATSQGNASVNIAVAAAQGKEITEENIGYPVTDDKYVWIDYVKVTQDNYQDYIS